jgi:cell division protein FtsL
MNAAAKALAQGSLASGNVRSIVLSRDNVGVVMLLLIVLTTAFAVVYVKDLNRRLFMELDGLKQARVQLKEEAGQLLLEQNTWATQARIQHEAQEKLGMVVPSPRMITIVTR